MVVVAEKPTFVVQVTQLRLREQEQKILWKTPER
jgi:hypothetical protein